jgi:hypothetical protein
MVVLISNVVAFVGGCVVIGGLIWFAVKGHDDRDAEDAARAFFDEHGRWPDEDAPTAT